MQKLLSFRLRFMPLFLLAVLALTANTCKKDKKNDMALNMATLQKTWLHSHEEDRGDTLFYRPNSYNFPPARGRTGFTLEADGAFKQYDIAPTDGLEEKPGRWVMRDERFLDVTFPNKKSTDFEVEIISVEPNLLKVKRTFKQ